MQISLSDFAKKHSQSFISKKLNVEQGYISRTLKAKKDVYIICNDDGTIDKAIEIKPFPNKIYKKKLKKQTTAKGGSRG